MKLTVKAEAQNQELTKTLAELEELHRVEASALRSLSRDTLDELTDRKLGLWERLRSLTSEVPPAAEHRAAACQALREDTNIVPVGVNEMGSRRILDIHPANRVANT